MLMANGIGISFPSTVANIGRLWGDQNMLISMEKIQIKRKNII